MHRAALADEARPELIEHAIKKGEGVLAANGAFTVLTGKYTGRSPEDKFFVKEGESANDIDWGKVNKPFDPDRFGSGLGAVLLAAAVDRLRAAGYRRATLWALRENTRARHFYEREGWRTDGTTKPHPFDGHVAVDVRYHLVLDTGP